MNNNVKATISSGYRWRLVLISLVMLGFGAYCVYDWQIGYPAKVEMYQTYLEIKEQNPDNYPEVWAAYAEPRGWSANAPKKKTDQDVFTQLLMALITLPIGLWFVFKLIVENGRWVAMDDQGITGSGGHRVTWESIQSLDEAKWQTKGIAWLHYKDDTGKGRRLLLDDFKSDRHPIKQIVTKVQHHLNPELAEKVAASTAESLPEPTGEAASSTAVEFNAGDLFAMREEDGQYSITKILAVDDVAIHIRTYAERFAEPPAVVATKDLTSQIGHAPIDRSGFDGVEHVALGSEPVADDELEGYRLWSTESV